MKARNPLTVGAVAHLLHVSKASALNWIHSGALHAYTTPGGHHRVWPADMRAFIDKTGMDIQFDFVEERKRLILIVDDDPVYAQLMKRILLEEIPQLEVMTTDDGYEALLTIGELSPQLLILDIKMPKVDGFKLLELLEARKPAHAMKVVVVSGHLDNEVRRRLADAGVDSAVEKGTGFTSILRTIVSLLKEGTEARMGVQSGSHGNLDLAPVHGHRFQKQMIT